jgi:ankyrin repeat protein
VLSNYAPCEYVDIVPKIVNKGIDVNAKHKNGEMPLYLACGNNYIEIISILCMVLNLLFTYFLFHRL